jgi:hypothetical protein
MDAGVACNGKYICPFRDYRREPWNIIADTGFALNV